MPGVLWTLTLPPIWRSRLRTRVKPFRGSILQRVQNLRHHLMEVEDLGRRLPIRGFRAREGEQVVHQVGEPECIPSRAFHEFLALDFRCLVGGSVCEELYRTGLCLPSGSAWTEGDRERVMDAVEACAVPGIRSRAARIFRHPTRAPSEPRPIRPSTTRPAWRLPRSRWVPANVPSGCR